VLTEDRPGADSSFATGWLGSRVLVVFSPLADGMTEELIAELSKIRTLKVISRTSVMRYKGKNKSLPEIARELNVDGVVEGSVERSGERVRITAQLIASLPVANPRADLVRLHRGGGCPRHVGTGQKLTRSVNRSGAHV
jgi:hypothetical protein